MATDDERPDAAAEEDATGRTASGPLRPHPGTAGTPWHPEAPTAPREVGDLEQRAAARRGDDLRRIQGKTGLQALGWTLFILGGLIYLHGLWATAGAALAGASDPQQTVAIGTTTFVQGTLGMALALIGLIVAVTFTFVPLRLEPPLHPGTLEFEVVAQNLVRSRDLRRILIWVGVGVFIIGLALAAYPLKESIARGTLYTVAIGGTDYRIHYWGYLLAVVGAGLAIPLAVGQGALERAADLAAGVLPGNGVRRVDEAGTAAPDEDPAPGDGPGPV